MLGQVISEPSGLDKHLWMTWALGPLDRDRWISTLEMIELLDLFVRVDYVAGWTWIFKTLQAPPYVGLLQKLPEEVYPKHRFEWHRLGATILESGTSLDRAEQLALAIPDELHSPEFLAVRDEMMARWGRQRRPEDCVRVCLQMEFDKLSRADTGLARALKELVEFAALVQDPDRHSLLAALEGTTPVAATPPSDVFQVNGFEVDARRTALTDALLTSMCAVTRRGLRLLRLVIGEFSPVADNLLTLPTLVAYLRSLLVLNTHAMALSVDVYHTDFEPEVFQAICSAVAATTSLCDVQFTRPPPSTRGRCWSWLAYALLRSDERPLCIASVCVNVTELTLQDVLETERVLRANDPLAALWVAAASDDRVREVVDVEPHATSYVRTRTTNDDATLAVVCMDEAGCRNLSVVGETVSPIYVGVLYPGAGVCFVKRDKIVGPRRVSSLPPSPPPPLHMLELQLDRETSLDALLRLLQLVGPSTQGLKLVGHENTVDDSFMNAVLAACPRLDQLDLTYIDFESFAWLVHNQTARFKSLKLAYFYLNDPQGFAPITDALRNTTRGLGSTLRELTIVGCIDGLKPSIPGFLAMLKTNHRLETLLFRTRHDGEEAFEPQLRSHHDEPLHIQDGPFPWRSRLALRSVFKHRLDLAVLESDTLDIVFELAATKRRVCGFAEHHVEYL